MAQTEPNEKHKERQKDTWLCRNWKYIASSVSGAIIGGCIVWFLSAGDITGGEKYDILVNVLVILLALLGAAGYGVYKWVSRAIESQLESQLRKSEELIEKATKERGNYIFARLFAHLGYISWLMYKPLPPPHKSKTSEAYLDLALELSKYAEEAARELEEEKYEELICDAKNILAYHLAVRGNRAKDGRKALNLAQYIYDKAQKYDENYEWIETSGWVLLIFGETQKQRSEGHKRIKALLDRKEIDRIDPEWRQKLQNKYQKFLKEGIIWEGEEP